MECNFRNYTIDGKCRNRHCCIFYVRKGVTYANDFNRHTHTETDKSIAIGEILKISLISE